MSSQAGPTGLTERALGRDLARGFMLLFIALANSHYFVAGDDFFGGFERRLVPRPRGRLIATIGNARAFPMVGVLFGYGVAQIVRRQREAGHVTPYLLDLSDTLATTATALLAGVTWLATVLLADRMRRAGYRGPFELLIRRVAYQPRRTAATRSRSSGSLA